MPDSCDAAENRRRSIVRPFVTMTTVRHGLLEFSRQWHFSGSTKTRSVTSFRQLFGDVPNPREWNLHSKCRNAYLPSCVVKKTRTGGSGVLTAVPLPRLPTMTEVALLPEKSVLAVVKLVERRLRFVLPANDARLPENDLGLIAVALLGTGLNGNGSGGSVGLCRLCGCHIWRTAFPVLCGLSNEPLIAHEMSFLPDCQLG